MAILDNNEFQFIGGFGRMTAYRMRGSDKIILRAKGGPSKRKIQTSPNFEHARLNNAEFCGAVIAARSIKSTIIFPIQDLANHNFSPKFVGICRKIQLLDTEKEKGQREVRLSAHRELLAGFLLNKKDPFVNVVLNPLHPVLDRETKTALIQLPRLTKGINLQLRWKLPLYRFLFSLGIVEDIVHDGNGYNESDRLPIATADTEWQESGTDFSPQTIELKLDIPEALRDTQTMILSIGIEMGRPDTNGEVQRVRHTGSACILALG
jgi:hypothetical protein